MKKVKLLSVLTLVAMMASLLFVPAAAASGEPSGEPASAAESIENMKVSSYGTLTANASRSSYDQGHLYVGYDIVDNALVEAESNWDTDDVATITLDNTVVGEGFTAVKINNSDVKLGGQLTIESGNEASGEFASDFTGTGIALLANAGSDVTVEDMDYESTGFIRGFAMLYGAADQPTHLHIKDSEILTYGANSLTDAYDGYYNSAQTTMMLSSPWVLGIQGGVRAVNVLGTQATLLVDNSHIAAGGWAVLSTDGCSAPRFWIMDSTLEILSDEAGGMSCGADILGYENKYGTGYGTFFIGSAEEHFYGVTFQGSTYASIMNGGTGYYNGLVAGESYELTDAMTEEVIEVYEADETIPTVMNTVFGITSQNTGTVYLNEGVEANVEEALFIYRSGNTEWNLNGADVNVASGVILSMIDNDDQTIGGFNPFGTYLYEDSGLKTEGYADSTTYTFTTDTEVDPAKTYYQADGDDFVVVENPVDEGTVAYYEKSTGGSQTTISFANGAYEGDVFNGTGYYDQASDALKVIIEDSAVLDGDIALTSHFHGISLEGRDVDQVIEAIEAQNDYHDEIGGYYEGLEDIGYEFFNADFEICDKDEAAYVHFTQFAIPEYFLLGQAEHAVNYNGIATADVFVEGTWIVEEESLVTYLNIAKGASVYGELIENADGTFTILPSQKLIPAGEYGEEFIYVAAAGSGEMFSLEM